MKKFLKTSVFYNHSLVTGMIIGALLERFLFGSGKQGRLWRLFEPFFN